MQELCKSSAKLPLASIYPHSDANFLRLIDDLLEYDTKTRLAATQALKSPFFLDIRDPHDEPEAVDLFDFNFEFCSPDQLRGEFIIFIVIYYINRQLLT